MMDEDDGAQNQDFYSQIMTNPMVFQWFFGWSWTWKGLRICQSYLESQLFLFKRQPNLYELHGLAYKINNKKDNDTDNKTISTTTRTATAAAAPAAATTATGTPTPTTTSSLLLLLLVFFYFYL